MKKSTIVKLIIGGAITLYTLFFLILNRDETTVNFVFGTIRMPLVLLILSSALLGVVMYWVTKFFYKIWRESNREEKVVYKVIERHPEPNNHSSASAEGYTDEGSEEKDE